MAVGAETPDQKKSSLTDSIFSTCGILPRAAKMATVSPA